MDHLAVFGYGYLPTQLAGQRPWTRRECASLLAQASDLLGQADPADEQSAALVSALLSDFAGELSGSDRGIRLESLYTRFTGIAGEPLADGYHLGQTIINDFGRLYGNRRTGEV